MTFYPDEVSPALPIKNAPNDLSVDEYKKKFNELDSVKESNLLLIDRSANTIKTAILAVCVVLILLGLVLYFKDLKVENTIYANDTTTNLNYVNNTFIPPAPIINVDVYVYPDNKTDVFYSNVSYSYNSTEIYNSTNIYNNTEIYYVNVSSQNQIGEENVTV